MTHEPECRTGGSTDPRFGPCICDEIRACEQRVLQVPMANAWNAGWREGVQVARDAVAAASKRIPYEETRIVYLTDALAAIDALRGDA